jgi:hypothetical protein
MAQGRSALFSLSFEGAMLDGRRDAALKIEKK